MTDYDYLLRALKLAERGLGHTRPNPAVGAVIAKDGKIIGEGWHKRAGKDHAEVAAIKNAVRRCGAEALCGSAIYVTLEPCSRPGRVGACTDAIAAAGISRVVYAVCDPNPKNRGRARRTLAKSGIECVRFRGDSGLVRDCGRLIAGFRKHVLTALPFVTVKMAMSLDGRICDDWGDSDWISSAASRTLTNLMRSRVDAIMVGAQTVRKDNPSLTSRVKPNRDLIRVVISRSGNLPKNAQVFTDGENPTLVFDDAEKALRELGKMGITSVLCEGGMTLARSLAEAGLVDEWLTVLSPVHIGSRRMSGAIRAATLAERCRFAHGDAFFAARFSDFAAMDAGGCRSRAVHR